MRLLFVALAFILANFIWQTVQIEPRWGVAIDRSFFQAIVLAYIWFFGVQP